jgi:hypothetical protein
MWLAAQDGLQLLLTHEALRLLARLPSRDKVPMAPHTSGTLKP